jgi:hypothetical protein
MIVVAAVSVIVVALAATSAVLVGHMDDRSLEIDF